MPTYTFKHKETDEHQTLVMSFAERDQFVIDNPDWIQVLSTPRIVSGVKSALAMTDDTWKDKLKQIDKAAGRHSKINV
jgi:hypothetical protein